MGNTLCLPLFRSRSTPDSGDQSAAGGQDEDRGPTDPHVIKLIDVNMLIERSEHALRNLKDHVGSNHSFVVEAQEKIATLHSWRRRIEGTDTEDDINQVHETDDPRSFIWDILLFDANSRWKVARALLDSQCQVGNWISRRLVVRLGLSHLISTDFDPFEMIEASGRLLQACGVIALDWMLKCPKATCIHHCRFYVFPNSDHIDVIFGAEYLVSNSMVLVNPAGMLTLVEHKRASKAEKDAIARAKERQRQERAALEERRKKEQEEKPKGQEGGN